MKLFATIVALSLESLVPAQYQNGGFVSGEGVLLPRVATMSQAPTPTVNNVILMNLENSQLYRWNLATLTWVNYDSVNIQNSKNIANGIAGLDASGKVSSSVLPANVVTAEADPKWISDSSSYMKKTQLAVVYQAKLPSTPLYAEVDGSVTNEMQTLSVLGSSLSISGGNSVTLPSSPVTSVNGQTGAVTLNAGKLWSKAGLLSSNAQTFSDTFSISANQPTIAIGSYLSAAGCTNFKLTSAVGYRASATSSNSPNITVTDISSNSFTLILNQTNSSTVTILGINVLSGLPTILVPDPTNVKVVLSFMMY